MAPFYCAWCQGVGVREAVECAPTLVGVNVVRPVGRSTLTPPARRRDVAAVLGPEVFRVGAWLGSLAGAGPGCGLSEEPMSGVRSVALDDRVAPECPPGPASCTAMVRSLASATSWQSAPVPRAGQRAHGRSWAIMGRSWG